MTSDGVVPLSDVPEYGNRLGGRHTLKLLPGVGHYYKEDGAKERLWEVLREWLVPRLRDAKDTLYPPALLKASL